MKKQNNLKVTSKKEQDLKKEIKKGRFDLVMPLNQWEMWITNYVKETGFDNCGLFCQAKSEKEARKIFKSLIKIIQKKGVEIND